MSETGTAPFQAYRVHQEDGRIEARFDLKGLDLEAVSVSDGALVVAVEDSLELSIDEWRQLGFRRIADSPFVFRDQLKVNPYEQASAEISDEAAYTCDGCGEENTRTPLADCTRSRRGRLAGCSDRD